MGALEQTPSSWFRKKRERRGGGGEREWIDTTGLCEEIVFGLRFTSKVMALGQGWP